MNVLSLFDGMRCGRIALERAGIEVTNYYASEVDKYAIKVADANWPGCINLGDVTQWKSWNIDWGSIDLILAGSPCQGFSFAGKQLAFNDPRSKLFFVFVDILNYIKELNPKVKFLLENVKMKQDYLDVITEVLGVDPALINSSLVSAQDRKRYYWTNWDFKKPDDKGILLKDILEDLPSCPIGHEIREKSRTLRVGGFSSPFGSRQSWNFPFQRIKKNGSVKPGVDKSACLTGGANNGGNHSDMDITHSEKVTRRYSITECERLQTVPDWYTQNKGVSNTQCYKMLGNGWTVDVIAHILKTINTTA